MWHMYEHVKKIKTIMDSDIAGFCKLTTNISADLA